MVAVIGDDGDELESCEETCEEEQEEEEEEEEEVNGCV